MAEVSSLIIPEYFDHLSKIVENIPASNIYITMMKVTYNMIQGKIKLIFQRGTKYPERIQNHSKSATSIMICGSSSGVRLLPYIIFKASQLWQS